MSLGTQGPRHPGLPPAARGAALIGLLVVIGIIGLQVLDDSGPSSGGVTVTTIPGQTTLPSTSSTLTPATTKAGTPATTKAASTATTKASTATTAKVKKPADLKVMVYNASGVQGMAANMADKLKSVGYNVIGTDNITPTRTGTTVSCRVGLEAEAAKLSNDVGSGATTTTFPANPPKGSDQADCIVILGKAA